jgi:hypothetical protein
MTPKDLEKIRIDGVEYSLRRIQPIGGAPAYGVFNLDVNRWHSGPFALKRLARDNWTRLMREGPK